MGVRPARPRGHKVTASNSVVVVGIRHSHPWVIYCLYKAGCNSEQQLSLFLPTYPDVRSYKDWRAVSKEPAFNKEQHIKSLRWIIVLALVIVLKPPYKQAKAAPVNLNKQDVQTVKTPVESKTEQPQIVEAVAQTPPPEPVPVPQTPREIGQQMAASYGWTGDQWLCLEKLWTNESNWRTEVPNHQGSGAYGIPQALPASKMASYGADYLTNPRTQIAWGLSYISTRYSTPCDALSFWNRQYPHWY